jgi:hypothetical protein
MPVGCALENVLLRAPPGRKFDKPSAASDNVLWACLERREEME